MPLLSHVRPGLTNLISSSNSIDHLNKHQLAEILLTVIINYKVSQDVFKNAPHLKLKCGKNTHETFGEREKYRYYLI